MGRPNQVPALQKAPQHSALITQEGQTRDQDKGQTPARAKLVLVAGRELTREGPPGRPVLSTSIPISAMRGTSLREGEDILLELINNGPVVAYVGAEAGCVHGVGGKRERVRESVMPTSHMP